MRGILIVAFLLGNLILAVPGRAADQTKECVETNNSIMRVLFTPDSRSILIAWEGGQAQVWGVRADGPTRSYNFTGRYNPMWSVAFSTDGKTILAGTNSDFDGTTFSGTAWLWDEATNSVIRSFPPIRTSGPITTVALSPDGKRALIGGDSPRLWDAKTGRLVSTLSSPGHVANSAAFTPDGKNVLTGGDDGTVRFWDAETGSPLRYLAGLGSEIQAVAPSPDGAAFVIGFPNGRISLRDARTGKELRQFDGHTGAVTRIAFSPEGKTMLTAEIQSFATGYSFTTLWDVQTGQELRRFRGSVFAYAPDGTTAIIGGEGLTDFAEKEDAAALWDLRTGQKLQTFALRDLYSITDVAFAPNGKTVLTVAYGVVRQWDVATGVPLRSFQPAGHGQHLADIAISPDSSRLLTGSYDETVRLWDSRTGRELHTLTAHNHNLIMVAFSPDGRQALTSSYDETVRLWDVQSGALVRTFETEDWIYHITFASDGKTWLGAGNSGTARIWDVQTGNLVQTIRVVPYGEIYVKWAAFSHDGRRLITSTSFDEIQVWDLRTTESLNRFSINTAYGLALAPDSDELLAGGRDVTLWNINTGTPLRNYPIPDDEIMMDVAFSPDGKMVLATGDGMVWLWDAQTARLIRTICPSVPKK